MKNYPRKVRRIVRRVRFNKFRRSGAFRPTRRSRLMRYALSRRPLRPEIKYIDTSYVNGAIGSSGNQTSNCSPLVMNQGVGEGLRVGDSVKFRKLLMHWTLTGPTANAGTGQVHCDDYYRLIFWTPRIDFAPANAYMGALLFDNIIDFNVVTVHSDKYIHIAAYNVDTYSVTSGGAASITGVYPTGQQGTKHITKSIMFPRNVKFAPTSVSGFNNLDTDKDIMYFTLINNFPTGFNSGGYSFYTRVTYTDN